MAGSKEQWGTRVGVILAVAGSAVGLGNFLRFPGQAAANGGGAFMIPYFCALILLGIPICWAEWTMGKYGGQHGFNSCPAIFGVLGRRSVWRYFGVLGLLVPIIIYMYYVLIESWCMGYAWSYLTGALDLGDDPSQYSTKCKDFFASFVGENQDGLMLDGKIHVSVIVWIIVFSVNFILIFRGLSKGIERFCTIAMPIMATCAFIVLIRVLTLGTPNPALPDQNVVNGLGFMWNPKGASGGLAVGPNEATEYATLSAVPEKTLAYRAGLREKDAIIAIDGQETVGMPPQVVVSSLSPDPKKEVKITVRTSGSTEIRPVTLIGDPWYYALFNAQTWMAAAGQIFFSLSVGFGVIINYASYLRRKDDIVLSGLTASSTNEFFEVCLGGLITIPAAFVFLGIAGAQTTGTFDLGFKTLPMVFAYMPAGRFFGFLWFFMLFLAAITSSLSMLQPAIAFLEEALGVGRKGSVALLGLITGLGSLFVLFFSKGLTALSTLDDLVGTVVIVLLATIQTILFSWVFGARRGWKFAQQGAELRLPKLFVFMIKYVTPVYLLFMLGMWCYNDLPAKVTMIRSENVPFLAFCLIVVVTVFLLVMINLAGRRWNAETVPTPAGLEVDD